MTEALGEGEVVFFLFLIALAAFAGDFFALGFAFGFGVFAGVAVGVALASGVLDGLGVGVPVGEAFFFFFVLGFGVGVGDGVWLRRDLNECAGVSSSVSCARRQTEPVNAAKTSRAANQSRKASTLAQGNSRRLAINVRTGSRSSRLRDRSRRQLCSGAFAFATQDGV